MRPFVKMVLLMLFTACPWLVAQQINAGGAALAGWAAGSTACVGGLVAAPVASAINMTKLPATPVVPQAVPQGERYGVFTCTVASLVAGARYNIELIEAEVYWKAAGKRGINVSINGAQVLTNYDIFAAAGGADIAVMPTFTATANAQGQIVISFLAATVDQSKIGGIVVTPILPAPPVSTTILIQCTVPVTAVNGVIPSTATVQATCTVVSPAPAGTGTSLPDWLLLRQRGFPNPAYGVVPLSGRDGVPLAAAADIYSTYRPAGALDWRTDK